MPQYLLRPVTRVGRQGSKGSDFSLPIDHHDFPPPIIWVIQNKRTNEVALLLTRPVFASETQGNSKLVFRKYDDLYFLSEFWAAGTNSGREIQVSNRERALAKSLAVAPTVQVLIDRGGR